MKTAIHETASGSRRRRASHNGKAARAGFTLVEVTVSLAILSLIAGGAFVVLVESQRLFTEQMRLYTLELAGRRVLNRLGDELRSADPGSVLPLVVADSSFLQYRKVTGFAGGVVQKSPLVTLGVELAAGESMYGADDNGDGLPDEGFLTYTEQGSPTIRISGHLLELRFNSTASGVAFSADMGIVNGRGEVVRRNFANEVTFRNPR
jgi:prepilin-type N-terminal cleavage/methylation domain-containing protein